LDLKIDGLLFDKDGTLFDFVASWGPWYSQLFQGLTPDKTVIDQMADAVRFDLETKRFDCDSVLIHGTATQFLDLIMPFLPQWNHGDLENHVLRESRKVNQIPVLPLAALLDGFLAAGLTLGIATNDNEIPAITQLKTAGIHDHFGFIAGCDSGFGAKPDHGMQTGFINASGIDAARIAMIGDSAHDMVSGRNAGMQTIAVLTGVASRADLAPLADVVLNDIGEIPGWMAG